VNGAAARLLAWDRDCTGGWQRLLAGVDEAGRGCWAGPVVAACGPEPMLAAVAALAEKQNVPCYVSLENTMSCGVGICFGCVCKTRDASGKTDYRRTCVEGPVFDAREVVWEKAEG